ELRAAGLSARLRVVDGERRIEVKPVPIDPGLVMDRAEVTVDVPDGAEVGDVLRDLLRDRLGLAIEGQPVEQLRLRTRRTRHVVRTSGMRAELAIDDVELEGASGFIEIELELEEGDAASLRHVASSIAELPGLSPSGQSKYERARSLAGLPG